MEREQRQVEYRTFEANVTLRQADDKKERITGHAAVFNTIGTSGYFREMVAPGAFTKTIEKDDVRALFNHNPDYVLGRNVAGTLQMYEDDKGLYIDIDPPDTQFANDLKVSIKRGDITQMSFGFEILAEERMKGEAGETDLYVLREVKLWDVSPVTYPFYKETDVTVHSRQAQSIVKRQDGLPIGVRLKLLRREFDLRRL